MNRKIFTIKDIVELIKKENVTIIGDINRTFHSVGPMDDARRGNLSFCTKRGEEALTLLRNSAASVILCRDDLELPSFEDKTLVLVENPRLWFIRCVKAFFPQKRRVGIHPTVIIGENCHISDDVFIGPYTVIGNDVIVESGSSIFSGVRILDRVRIGKNVIIKSGSVIGSDGFGYEKNEAGVYERFPHFGSVIIEDNVNIGANTCIDRGTLSDTIIGKGTKIDNLVHIAHNVVIGKNCIIVCLSCIAGGAQIGDGAWIAPLAVIRDGISVGKNAIVGMGAVVTKNVDDYDVVAGVPARSIKHGRKE